MEVYILYIVFVSVILLYSILSYLTFKERKYYESQAQKAIQALNGVEEAWRDVYNGDKALKRSNEMYKSLKMISTLDGDRFASMEAKEILAKIGVK